MGREGGREGGKVRTEEGGRKRWNSTVHICGPCHQVVN